MSNLKQETVKVILDASHSTNLTIESFVIMAISTENPLSRSFLNGGVETLLITCSKVSETDLICVTVSKWVAFQAMKRSLHTTQAPRHPFLRTKPEQL